MQSSKRFLLFSAFALGLALLLPAEGWCQRFGGGGFGGGGFGGGGGGFGRGLLPGFGRGNSGNQGGNMRGGGNDWQNSQPVRTDTPAPKVEKPAEKKPDPAKFLPGVQAARTGLGNGQSGSARQPQVRLAPPNAAPGDAAALALPW